MADYISKDKIINLLEYNDKVYHYADRDKENIVYDTVQTLCKVILDAEAADVQPVKHGKWEKKKGYLVCNNCGMVVDTIGYTYEEQDEVFRYCSCCGFRMDGEQNE